jgi:formylglycine-generating enzyme required for sulfatase activity
MIHTITICAVFLLGFAGIGIAAPVAGDTMTDPELGMEFVWVPKGCVKMSYVQAASKGELLDFSDRDSESIHVHSSLDELPEGETCMKKGFWIGKFEVTQGQYSKVTGSNPSAFKKGDSYPVENVRWIDVQSFILNINKQTGKNFRLPSEAEWEYAARSGGKKQKYGAEGTVDKAGWYMKNSSSSSHPVGQKQANALGLHDMSGNVWEWTQDCWNANPEGAPEDGSARLSGDCTSRVLRGGSWYDVAEFLTTASRLWNEADKADNNSGFRLVQD